MRVSRKFSFVLAVSLLVFLPLGCSTTQQQAGVTAPQTLLSGISPRPWAEANQPTDGSIAKRFQDAAPQNRTAVESAMELLEKHAELSRQAAELERKNQDYLAENNRLKEQITALETELAQAQKELTQANDLLVEMRIELNNWKTNILGFRDEMRQAEMAQLEALLKILKVLGGEVTADLSEGQDIEDTAVTSVSPGPPGQLAPASPDARPSGASRGGGAKSQEAPTPGAGNG